MYIVWYDPRTRIYLDTDTHPPKKEAGTSQKEVTRVESEQGGRIASFHFTGPCLLRVLQAFLPAREHMALSLGTALEQPQEGRDQRTNKTLGDTLREATSDFDKHRFLIHFILCSLIVPVHMIRDDFTRLSSTV